MNTVRKFCLAIVAVFFINGAFSQNISASGSVAMSASKNIGENLASSSVHSLFFNAVEHASIRGVLAEQGPYTLFAPVNDAFNDFSAAEKDKFLNPESSQHLKDVVNYHIIEGNINSKELARLIKLGSGFATLKTLSGKTLTVSMKGSKIVIKDENGDAAIVTTRDLPQQNGMIHFIDRVLQPKQ